MFMNFMHKNRKYIILLSEGMPGNYETGIRQAYLKMETKSMRRKNCKRKSQMLILQSNMRDHENCLF